MKSFIILFATICLILGLWYLHKNRKAKFEISGNEVVGDIKNGVEIQSLFDGLSVIKGNTIEWNTINPIIDEHGRYLTKEEVKRLYGVELDDDGSIKDNYIKSSD